MQIQNDSILRNWQTEHMLASYEMIQTVPLSVSGKPAQPPLSKGKFAEEIAVGFGVDIANDSHLYEFQNDDWKISLHYRW